MKIQVINILFLILYSGANVNVLPTCGRTVLGRAAQLGHLAIVCLLLDAEKFYTTPEEEDVDTEVMFSSCVTTADSQSTLQANATSPTCPTLSSVPVVATSSSAWPTLPISSAATPSTSSLRPSLGSSLRSPQQPHKCCSPSIDSETCTCSDEVSCRRLFSSVFLCFWIRYSGTLLLFPVSLYPTLTLAVSLELLKIEFLSTLVTQLMETFAQTTMYHGL